VGAVIPNARRPPAANAAPTTDVRRITFAGLQLM
jgi:hypothetical protein